MDMLATLRRSGGVEALARKLGITPTAAAVGVEALLPALLGGFRKHGEAGGGESGIGNLIAMLAALGGGTLAAQVMDPDQNCNARGNEILGSIFGSKEVSRSVAGYAADATGLEPALLGRMLPQLAMLVGGYLSARAQGSGAQGSSGLAGIGVLIGAGSEGNALDDIIAMSGKLGPA